ncbi:hypothetical protein Y032_0204g1887 [Ancylostoma ceylanicum]|uniref:Uncharacterized protein n=1 Tax=Ancylostoma ceylanicum TaxID=53326 RepID=A0A016SLN8_9BILA|nr:hypothetical protein Y032_0204g1887 [Ancylostoma ceylanicum]
MGSVASQSQLRRTLLRPGDVHAFKNKSLTNTAESEWGKLPASRQKSRPQSARQFTFRESLKQEIFLGLYLRTGSVPIPGMLKSVASLDYIKFSLAAIEKGLQLCKQKAKQVIFYRFFGFL